MIHTKCALSLFIWLTSNSLEVFTESTSWSNWTTILELRGVASWVSFGLTSSTWDWRSSQEAGPAWVEVGGAGVEVEGVMVK